MAVTFKDKVWWFKSTDIKPTRANPPDFIDKSPYPHELVPNAPGFEVDTGRLYTYQEDVDDWELVP